MGREPPGSPGSSSAARAGHLIRPGPRRFGGRIASARAPGRAYNGALPARRTPMTDDVARMPVIDVDSHWTEPPDLWTSRAPAKLASRALRVQKNAAGVEQWVIEDGQVMGSVGYASIRPDGSKTRGRIAFDTSAEVPPCASD